MQDLLQKSSRAFRDLKQLWLCVNEVSASRLSLHWGLKESAETLCVPLLLSTFYLFCCIMYVPGCQSIWIFSEPNKSSWCCRGKVSTTLNCNRSMELLRYDLLTECLTQPFPAAKKSTFFLISRSKTLSVN